MTTQPDNTVNLLPEAVYTPESDLRHPGQLIKRMWKDLLASRELAWRLMVRDISANYRQSFLGIFWAFLPPIVLAFGFTLAGNAKVINIAATELPYPAYVMFSVILWQTFVESLNGPVTAVTKSKEILARVNFPREAIVVAKLGEVFFSFGIKLILIVGVFLVYKMPITWSALLSPLALIQLVMLGTFIGLLLAPLGALYQDVAHGITVMTSLWLFLTPVIYPLPTSGTFATIVKFNPVTPVLVTTRELATTGVVSQLTPFLIISAITLVGLLVTWISFRLALPFAIERGGS